MGRRKNRRRRHRGHFLLRSRSSNRRFSGTSSKRVQLWLVDSSSSSSLTAVLLYLQVGPLPDGRPALSSVTPAIVTLNQKRQYHRSCGKHAIDLLLCLRLMTSSITLLVQGSSSEASATSYCNACQRLFLYQTYFFINLPVFRPCCVQVCCLRSVTSAPRRIAPCHVRSV